PRWSSTRRGSSLSPPCTKTPRGPVPVDTRDSPDTSRSPRSHHAAPGLPPVPGSRRACRPPSPRIPDHTTRPPGRRSPPNTPGSPLSAGAAHSRRSPSDQASAPLRVGPLGRAPHHPPPCKIETEDVLDPLAPAHQEPIELPVAVLSGDPLQGQLDLAVLVAAVLRRVDHSLGHKGKGTLQMRGIVALHLLLRERRRPVDRPDELVAGGHPPSKRRNPPERRAEARGE